MAPGKKRFAAGTTVPPSQSREELDKLVRRYGAAGFGYVDHKTAVAITFELNNFTYRYLVKMPQPSDFGWSDRNTPRENAQAKKEWEQATREVWRALVATIKGKMVAVDTGIETVEEAFFRNTVMENGQTAGEYFESDLKRLHHSGHSTKQLTNGNGPKALGSIRGDII